MSKTLIEYYPGIVKEWDYTKNGKLMPSDISYGSNRKVWLICSKCNKSFLKTVKDRTRYIDKSFMCKSCRSKETVSKRDNSLLFKHAAKVKNNRKIQNGQSLLEKRPDIAKQWDYVKNGGLTPKDVTCGSHDIVWWICDKKHSYKQMIKSKSNGYGCPYCANKKLLPGFNDLKTIRPDLAKEWNYEKNFTLRPEHCFPSQAKKVWWTCENGHDYQKTINNRNSKNEGCPICSVRYVNVGVNDFKTLYPEMAEQWDYEKNGYNRPENFLAGSGYRAHWICGKGHRWITTISSRTADNTGCPFCKREIRTSFPEQAMTFYVSKYFKNVTSRNNMLGVEADILIENIKTVIEYDGVYWHKKKLEKDIKKNEVFNENGYRIIRLREKGLENLKLSENIVVENYQSDKLLGKAIEELLIKLGVKNPDVDLKRDNEKIYKRYISIQKTNSIAKRFPELLLDWDYEKNGILKPDQVAVFSRVRVHWKCHKCGYEWSTIAQSRTKTGIIRECPNCLKNRTYKRILNVDTGIIYKNIHDAAKSCNGNEKVIYRCCLGHRKTAYGFSWKYVN